MNKTAKKVSCFVTACVFAFGCYILPKTTKAYAANGFYCSGSDIMDANGNKFVMRGVNYPWSWDGDKYMDSAFSKMASLGANCVRVVINDGKAAPGCHNEVWKAPSESQLEGIIECCKKNNMICIPEVQGALGVNDEWRLQEAVDYWKSMKNVLNKYQKYCIVNIANEWGDTGWTNVSGWTSGYQKMIPQLRNAGIENMLMVDAGGWGQHAACIPEGGSGIVSSDSKHNTVFSIHMYENAGKDYNTAKNNIYNAKKIAPVVIGEFGHRTCGGDQSGIMKACQEQGAGYMGWSWYNNGGDDKILDLATDWYGSGLTSCGNNLFYGDNGIKKTAKTCTVFGGSNPNPPTPTPPTPTPPTDGTVIDSFDNVNSGDYKSNQQGGSISISGSNKMGKVDINFNGKGYAGLTKQINTMSWSGSKLSIAYTGSSNVNSLTIQCRDTNGNYAEASQNVSTGSKSVTFDTSSFKTPTWSSGSIDLSKVCEYSMYFNGNGSNTVYVDNFIVGSQSNPTPPTPTPPTPTPPTDGTVIDDFNHIGNGGYNRNTGGGDLSISGQNGQAKIGFNFNGRGYAGFSKSINSMNWSGSSKVSLAYTGNSNVNSVTLQCRDTNGNYAESTQNVSSGSTVLNFNISSFNKPGWAYSKADMSKICEYSVYINGSGSGTIYLDNLMLGSQDNPNPPTPVKNKPENLKTVYNSNGYIMVTWDAVSGSNSYTVSVDGTKVGSSSSTAFAVSGLYSGKSYKVTVAPNNGESADLSVYVR